MSWLLSVGVVSFVLQGQGADGASTLRRRACVEAEVLRSSSGGNLVGQAYPCPVVWESEELAPKAQELYQPHTDPCTLSANSSEDRNAESTLLQVLFIAAIVGSALSLGLMGTQKDAREAGRLGLALVVAPAVVFELWVMHLAISFLLRPTRAGSPECGYFWHCQFLLWYLIVVPIIVFGTVVAAVKSLRPPPWRRAEPVVVFGLLILDLLVVLLPGSYVFAGYSKELCQPAVWWTAAAFTVAFLVFASALAVLACCMGCIFPWETEEASEEVIIIVPDFEPAPPDPEEPEPSPPVFVEEAPPPPPEPPALVEEPPPLPPPPPVEEPVAPPSEDKVLEPPTFAVVEAPVMGRQADPPVVVYEGVYTGPVLQMPAIEARLAEEAPAVVTLPPAEPPMGGSYQGTIFYSVPSMPASSVLQEIVLPPASIPQTEEVYPSAAALLPAALPPVISSTGTLLHSAPAIPARSGQEFPTVIYPPTAVPPLIATGGPLQRTVPSIPVQGASVFDTLDRNHDGVLTQSELQQAAGPTLWPWSSSGSTVMTGVDNPFFLSGQLASGTSAGLAGEEAQPEGSGRFGGSMGFVAPFSPNPSPQ